MNYNTNIKQEHQKIVTDVLNKDDDIQCMKAIDEISNEEVLAIIACHADNGKIAEKCIDNIHDDYLLYNIIIDDVDLKTIEYAIGKIKNRNLLINLFNNLDDIDISLARIIMEKMEDCNMLIDVILGDDYASDIKLTALDRVSNKDAFLLKDVLLNVDNPDIIEACCKRINDEYFLYTMLPDTDFFLSKSEAMRYEYIINFINDKHLLSHILENNNNEHIQEFVKDKLDILSNQDKKSGNQEFITRKFKDDRLKERYESCFIHADFNMDDFKNKAEIFLLNPNMHIRKNAVYNIENQQLLKHIVLNDPEKSIRLAAVNRIVDENIIKDIYTRSGYDLAIRNICLKKISDDEYIRDILIKTPQYIDIVLDELDDEDVITDLLLNNWNKEFYQYIDKLVAKIHNLTNLVKLASFANYWKVRRIAIIQFEKEYDMLENKWTNYFRTIKLSDWTYYYIITHGKYLDVKIRAINKITDKFVLLRISFIAETFIERSTALRKLRR